MEGREYIDFIGGEGIYRFHWREGGGRNQDQWLRGHMDKGEMS